MTANREVALSIVVPVYNARPFLPEFFDSIRKQTFTDIEIIAVNDGSTDESGEYLDSMTGKLPHLTVVHQENSGWAGAPRNRGIERAQGRYVFFADPDDEFGDAEALERLVSFADDHSSDVVVPKMVARGGRQYAQWRYSQTQVDADIPTVFTTLTPQKLVRRSLLMEHRIRFPEGQVRLEDGIFLSRAYLLAERVSILADREYYVLVHHDEGDHLSKRAIDPVSYLDSVTAMVDNIVGLSTSADVANAVIAELVQRKLLLGTRPDRAYKARTKRLRQWFAPQREFAARFLTDDTRMAALREVDRKVIKFALRDDAEGLKSWAQAQMVEVDVVHVGATKGTLHIQGHGLPRDVSDVSVELVQRDQHHRRMPLDTEVGQQTWSADVPKKLLRRPDETEVFDLYITLTAGGQSVRKRVGSDLPSGGLRFTDDRSIAAYTTDKGNLSLRVSRGLSIAGRAKRAAKRLLG